MSGFGAGACATSPAAQSWVHPYHSLMPGPSSAAIDITFLLLAAIAITIVAQLLTGGINMRGLLRVKSPDGSHELSPARIQLLIGTIVTAAAYITAIPAAIGTSSLPDVDPKWLYGLGASHLFYLASKFQRFIPLRSLFRGIASPEE